MSCGRLIRAVAHPPPFLRCAAAFSSDAAAAAAARRVLKVGNVMKLARKFSEEDVAAYSAVSGDANPLHFDGEFARSAGFEGRIVHGMLVASLFPTIIASHFREKPRRRLKELSRHCVLIWKAIRTDRCILVQYGFSQEQYMFRRRCISDSLFLLGMRLSQKCSQLISEEVGKNT